jgi:hypothetical protein
MHRSSLSLRIAAVGLGACALAACASVDDNYHFSQILGNRYFRVPIDTYPVSIVSVDGKTTASFKPTLVDPGLRQITVQGPPGGAHVSQQKTLALEVAACTRYYLVAVKQNPLDSDFAVRVDHQEPVSGCTPPRAS